MTDAAEDRRRALYERYLAVPAHKHAEIVNGTLYVLPRPAPRHASAASALGGELNPPFQRARGGPGGWWILFEPELHLVPEEPVVPDLAGWRVERMPELPETSFFSLAPDWVCEVLSPSTERIDRNEKLPLYARHRVPYVWLVDPVQRILEVHILDDERRWREVRIHRDGEVVRAPPFEEHALELSALWSPPKKA